MKYLFALGPFSTFFSAHNDNPEVSRDAPDFVIRAKDTYRAVNQDWLRESMPIFHKPFEVTQFWALDRYSTHEKRSSRFTARLMMEAEQKGKWFFYVELAGTDLSLGNYLPPFLPTRANIAAINSAADMLFLFMDTLHRTGRKELPERDPLKLVTAAPTDISRNMRDYAYRNSLFNVLAEDWGIDLPLPGQFGKEIITFSSRPGLPCAAAMISAVEPLLTTAWGPIKKEKVTTINREGRIVDLVSYSTPSGESMIQEFDITEFYGRNLPMTDFEFSPVLPNRSSATGLTRKAEPPLIATARESEGREQREDTLNAFQDEAEDMLLYASDLFLVLKRGLADGHPPRVLTSAAYQAITKQAAPYGWLLNPPTLRELTTAVLKHKLNRPPHDVEVDAALEVARRGFGLIDKSGSILIYKKPWWKFWGNV